MIIKTKQGCSLLQPCFVLYGAGARNRTKMDVSPEDFESYHCSPQKASVYKYILVIAGFSFPIHVGKC